MYFFDLMDFLKDMPVDSVSHIGLVDVKKIDDWKFEILGKVYYHDEALIWLVDHGCVDGACPDPEKDEWGLCDPGFDLRDDSWRV